MYTYLTLLLTLALAATSIAGQRKEVVHGTCVQGAWGPKLVVLYTNHEQPIIGRLEKVLNANAVEKPENRRRCRSVIFRFLPLNPKPPSFNRAVSQL